jgi:hypothetical protein
MGRNYLRGRDRDCINAVLAAVGYNFGLLLRWLERLLCALLRALRRQSKSPENSQSLVFHGRLNRLAVGFQTRHAMCGFANARTGQLCQSCASLGGGPAPLTTWNLVPQPDRPVGTDKRCPIEQRNCPQGSVCSMESSFTLLRVVAEKMRTELFWVHPATVSYQFIRRERASHPRGR